MSYNNYNYNNNGYNNNNKGGYNNNGNYNKQTRSNTNEKNGRAGSIWRGTTKAGAEYLSIIIGNQRYVAFLNNYKNAPNQPDFYILESNSNTGDNGTQVKTAQNGYNNQNVNYAKKTYVQNNAEREQNNVEAYYAAQNMPIGMSEFKRNEFENTVDDINDLPGNDMPVF